MRYIVLFLLLVGSGVTYAQEVEISVDRVEAPDNDAILRETIDANSPYYYPILFARYQQGDTTLTPTDYRYLYYGFVWRPEYKPFETSSARDKILGILESDSLNPETYLKIVELGKEVLKREPFDPSILNYLTFAYGVLGDSVNERINYDRLQGVLGTICSSGTGLSEKSPWHIIYFSHVRDFLSSESILAGRERVISRTVAYTPLLVKIKGAKGFYFDFSRIYWQRPDKLPEKRSNGWEFNGLPLKKRVSPTVETVD